MKVSTVPDEADDERAALHALDAPCLRILTESAQRLILPLGAKVFEAGTPCDHYIILTRGQVRVQQIAESGREIVLYRIGGGDTCVLTTACLLAHEAYAAEAITESEVAALVVPRACFDRLLAESAAFRNFVFKAYASRLTDLLLLVEEVAFGHVDVRLAERLLALKGSSDALSVTHQDLAVELGTAREVVSRQLREFERHGWIRRSRGRIDILDAAALGGLAGSS
ncbi:MAG: Crp/Fnr family transcriptional regulator [Pseudomonadota bacterium]